MAGRPGALTAVAARGDDLLARRLDFFDQLIHVPGGHAVLFQRRLQPAEFRRVQRERLRAAAAYIRVAGNNAAVLVTIGQAALAVNDAATIEAAHQLIDNALLLRRNATVALLRIYVALLWPQHAPAAAPVLHGYEQLSGRAMLLGRLQNPAVPVRISANL